MNLFFRLTDEIKTGLKHALCRYDKLRLISAIDGPLVKNKICTIKKVSSEMGYNIAEFVRLKELLDVFLSVFKFYFANT